MEYQVFLASLLVVPWGLPNKASTPKWSFIVVSHFNLSQCRIWDFSCFCIQPVTGTLQNASQRFMETSMVQRLKGSLITFSFWSFLCLRMCPYSVISKTIEENKIDQWAFWLKLKWVLCHLPVERMCSITAISYVLALDSPSLRFVQNFNQTLFYTEAFSVNDWILLLTYSHILICTIKK